MVDYQPQHYAGRSARRTGSGEGVESNTRLTAATAVVLFLLFAVEGVTILRIRAHLSLHVFVGMLLIPPVLLKIGSTTWRFARYYSGHPAYRRKGPPHPVLRMLGPVLVALSVIMLASGVALVLDSSGLGGRLLFIHQASFVLWFAVMTIHVIGHAAETARLAPMDVVRRTRMQVRGASARQWALAASLAVGAVLGAIMLSPTAQYLNHTGQLIKH
jgi:hypothetical protein